MRQVTIAWILSLALAAPAVAAPQETEDPKSPEAPEAPAENGDDLSVTAHEITIRGKALAYTATAGTLPLKEEDDTVKADVFFMAYTLDGVEDVGARPVTFVFNGGPGSSSVWLHLGAFGPRRVDMGEDGLAAGPPYRLIDNEGTILDLTDLVFIDPVTTGYSRAAEEEDASQFHGVQEDVESVGEFIRLYTTRFGRWGSPKYLAGESYGTTRAAGLAGYLQSRHGMFLNGVILVSAILNFQTARFDRGNDLPYILYLPTCAATAWYHGKIARGTAPDLPALLTEVRDFAGGEYAAALMQGDELPDRDRRRIEERLVRYTGLSPEFVERSDLRISMSRFTKELLRDRDRTVGRLDSRFVGIDADQTASSPEYDPSYSAIQGPYTATLNEYVRRDLAYESDLTYEILTGRVRPWNYGRYQNRYVNVAETMREAMTRNPSLRLFVASGYYDFATPFYATDYTLSHLGLDPSLRDHVTVHYYEAGHMMYIHRPSLEKLRRDLDRFYGDR